jgi:hypothetical protein
MIILILLVGLTAIVIGLWEDSDTAWRPPLLLYGWGVTVGLAAAYVIPIVIGEVFG